MANGDDFNLDISGLGPLERMLQGAHLEGQKLNAEEAAKAASSSTMSESDKAELRKQKNNERAKARRVAKKAGFNSPEAHQEHMTKVNSMYDGARANSEAVHDQHIENLKSVQNVNKPINMPIDGNTTGHISEEIDDNPNGPKSANGKLQAISNSNRERNKRYGFGRPANLALSDNRATFLQAAISASSTNTNQTAQETKALTSGNSLANVTPKIATPINYPTPTPALSGQATKALPGGTSANNAANGAESAEDKASKARQKKSRNSGSNSDQANSRPWWEKMQDTLDSIDENVKKILELAQRHGGKTPNFNDVQNRVSGTDSSSGMGGLAEALGPLLMVIGAMLVAKFGAAAAAVLNGTTSLIAKGMAKIDTFVDGAKNAAKAAETIVSDTAKSGIDALGKDASLVGKTGSSLAVRAEGFLANRTQDAEGIVKNNWTKAGEHAADIFNRVKGAAGALGDGAKSLINKVPPGYQRLAAKAGKLPLAGAGELLHRVGRGATVLVGAEAGYQGYESYQDFKKGDNYHGTISGLKAGSDYMGMGGAKGLKGAIGSFGKRVVTAGAIEAAGGGPADPMADALSLATMVGGSWALDKTANYLSTKNGKKTFDGISNSNMVKDSNLMMNAVKYKGNNPLLAAAAAPGTAILGVAGGAFGAASDAGGAFGNMLGGKFDSWYKNQHKTNNNQLIQNAKEEHDKRIESPSQKAQAMAATGAGQRSGNTSNVTHNNTTNINIAKADVTSPDAAKKLLQDALKKQMQVQAQQQKANEKHSTPAQTNIFGTIQNGVSSLIAQII